MGEHAHTGGVEQQVVRSLLALQPGVSHRPDREVSVPQKPGIVQKLLPQSPSFFQAALPAGDGQGGTGSLLRQLKGQGPGSASIPQEQHTPAQGYPVVFQRLAAARAVGGVADKLLPHPLDGIHRTKPAGLFFQLV